MCRSGSPIYNSEIVRPCNQKPGNVKGPECDGRQERKKEKKESYFCLVEISRNILWRMAGSYSDQNGPMPSPFRNSWLWVPRPSKGEISGARELPILWSNLGCLGKELRKRYSADQTRDLFFMCFKLSGKIKLNLPMIYGYYKSKRLLFLGFALVSLIDRIVIRKSIMSKSLASLRKFIYTEKKSPRGRYMGITSLPLLSANVTAILAEISHLINDLKEKLKW